jgi:hypothetical protein
MCWDISYHDHNSDDEIPAGIFPTMTTTVTMRYVQIYAGTFPTMTKTVTMRYLLGYFLP